MRKLLFVSVISILLLSCSQDEEKLYPFDRSPYVEFEELISYDDDQNTPIIELSFIVWDKEGDLGIQNDAFTSGTYPFHQYDVVVDGSNDAIRYGDEFNPPFQIVPANWFFDPEILASRFFFQTGFSESLDLPVYPELNCDDYVYCYDGDIKYEFLGFANKHYHNLRVHFFDDSGEELDFNELIGTDDCNAGDYNARIQDVFSTGLNNSFSDGIFTVVQRNEYSWKVTYRMRSLGLYIILKNRLFEVRFSMDDRALNESNIASTDLVTLEDISTQ